MRIVFLSFSFGCRPRDTCKVGHLEFEVCFVQPESSGCFGKGAMLTCIATKPLGRQLGELPITPSPRKAARLIPRPNLTFGNVSWKGSFAHHAVRAGPFCRPLPAGVGPGKRFGRAAPAPNEIRREEKKRRSRSTCPWNLSETTLKFPSTMKPTWPPTKNTSTSGIAGIPTCCCHNPAGRAYKFVILAKMASPSARHPTERIERRVEQNTLCSALCTIFR